MSLCVHLNATVGYADLYCRALPWPRRPKIQGLGGECAGGGVHEHDGLPGHRFLQHNRGGPACIVGVSRAVVSEIEAPKLFVHLLTSG